MVKNSTGLITIVLPVVESKIFRKPMKETHKFAKNFNDIFISSGIGRKKPCTGSPYTAFIYNQYLSSSNRRLISSFSEMNK